MAATSPRPARAGWPALPALPLAWRAHLRTALEAAAVTVLLGGLFALVQYATPALAGQDAYYHIRLAQLIRAEGALPRFVWLPLTILRPEAYSDHHLLYHLYLAPFTGAGDAASLVAGAKAASVLLPALAGLAVWALLRGQGVRWAGLWTLGLCALSEAFLYRLSMARAQSASLLLLVLALHWLLQRRYWALLPLGFVYVWLYDGFPLLLVVVAVYGAAAWATERRLAWPALAFAAAGLALGLILNPYFPQNVIFIVQHILPKLASESIAVGNEWYPYETWTLVENSGPALAAFVLGALALAWQGRRPGLAPLTAFGLCVVFGLLVLRSRRFIEYYPAFALIFLALAASPSLAGWAVALGARWPGWRGVLAARLTVPAVLAAALALPLAHTLTNARAAMARSQPATRYAEAAAWLAAHTPPGSLVFQTDWDDFPRLFFHNPRNLYTVGLDPTYLDLYDHELYLEWVALTRGERTPPGPAIHARFGAEYVFTDRAHTGFIRAAQADPSLREVYRDADALIFQVLVERRN